MKLKGPFILIVDLKQIASRMSEEDFLRELGGPVLVGKPPNIITEGDEWSYRTASKRTVTDFSEGKAIVVQESDAVFILKKAPDARFADTILIGRAASNDVCINHSSISKLHARVRLLENSGYEITDAGSRNGTEVSEVLLSGENAAALTDGSSIVIGACSFQFQTASRLYRILKKLN